MLYVVVQQVFNLDCVRVLDEDGIHVDLTVTRQMMETVAMQGRNTQTSSPRPLVLQERQRELFIINNRSQLSRLQHLLHRYIG